MKAYSACCIIPQNCQMPVSAITRRSMRPRTYWLSQMIQVCARSWQTGEGCQYWWSWRKVTTPG